MARRKRVQCKWCHGAHLTNECQNPTGSRPIIKRYGTTVDGRYIPPPGIKVRHIQIPCTIHGDRLTTILKELDRETD